jgi:hypothetical protein
VAMSTRQFRSSIVDRKYCLQMHNNQIESPLWFDYNSLPRFGQHTYDRASSTNVTILQKYVTISYLLHCDRNESMDNWVYLLDKVQFDHFVDMVHRHRSMDLHPVGIDLHTVRDLQIHMILSTKNTFGLLKKLFSFPFRPRYENSWHPLSCGLKYQRTTFASPSPSLRKVLHGSAEYYLYNHTKQCSFYCIRDIAGQQ